MIIEPLPQCPTCNIVTIDQWDDDGNIIFVCTTCGWLRLAQHRFNVGVWHVAIRQALAPFDILQSLLTDPSIIPILVPRLKGGYSHLTITVPHVKSDKKYYEDEVKIANNVYLSQIIVLLVTHAEQIIKDFYKCLFLAQPQRMNQIFALDGKGKAMIELNKILQASTKEALILTLAEEAAGRAAGLGISVNIGRIVIVYMLYILAEAAIGYGVVTVDETNLIRDGRSR